jgi:hypothetical protein
MFDISQAEALAANNIISPLKKRQNSKPCFRQTILDFFLDHGMDHQ